MKHVERIFDAPMWVVCWLAYLTVLILPIGRRDGPATWLWRRLLPLAGFYAYHEPDLPWRWSERVR